MVHAAHAYSISRVVISPCQINNRYTVIHARRGSLVRRETEVDWLAGRGAEGFVGGFEVDIYYGFGLQVVIHENDAMAVDTCRAQRSVSDA
jgi:hypothetical protein